MNLWSLPLLALNILIIGAVVIGLVILGALGLHFWQPLLLTLVWIAIVCAVIWVRVWISERHESH